MSDWTASMEQQANRRMLGLPLLVSRPISEATLRCQGGSTFAAFHGTTVAGAMGILRDGLPPASSVALTPSDSGGLPPATGSGGLPPPGALGASPAPYGSGGVPPPAEPAAAASPPAQAESGGLPLPPPLQPCMQPPAPPRGRVELVSFGVAHNGRAFADFVGADITVDLSCLARDRWNDQDASIVLGERAERGAAGSGLATKVRQALKLNDRFEGALRDIVEQCADLKRGQDFVAVAVACKCGKHRSVAMVEEISEQLRAYSVRCVVLHLERPRMGLRRAAPPPPPGKHGAAMAPAWLYLAGTRGENAPAPSHHLNAPYITYHYHNTAPRNLQQLTTHGTAAACPLSPGSGGLPPAIGSGGLAPSLRRSAAAALPPASRAAACPLCSPAVGHGPEFAALGRDLPQQRSGL